MAVVHQKCLAKLNSLGKKIYNSLFQAKTYWSILKTFNNEKKNPLIPPLVVDNSFITDIKTKANTFNTFFAEQCKLTNYAHLN